MSRREGANAVLFGEKPGPVLCHLQAPIVPKLGTHSYGQNLISIELNPNVAVKIPPCELKLVFSATHSEYARGGAQRGPTAPRRRPRCSSTLQSTHRQARSSRARAGDLRAASHASPRFLDGVNVARWIIP